MNQYSSFATSIVFEAWDKFKSYPLLIISFLITLYMCRIAYDISLHPLSAIPGPFLAKFSNLWINFHYFRGTWHDDIVHLHQKYGPVVRIRSNEISFVDVDALKTLYSHSTGTKKTTAYDVWANPNASTSFFATRDVALHKFLRSRVSPAYAMSSVLAVEPYIQEIADKLWMRFRTAASTNTPLDLSEWTYYFAFDVVAQLTLGGELGFVQQGKDIYGVVESIHIGGGLLANMAYMPLQTRWLTNPFAQWATERFGGEKANMFPNFVKWLGGTIAARMQTGTSSRRDMLQHFIEMRGHTGTDRTTKEEILCECLIMIGAGADTTAAAIVGVLGRMVTNPEILAPLRAEVDAAYKKLGLDARSGISYHEAAKLPYTAAVVKESMRLCAPITYQLPRCTPEGGIRIGEFDIPGGVAAGISVCTINRSREIYGDDAEEFMPDRWISRSPKDEERIKKMNKLLMTFGMGDRACIGQNIAQVEISKFITQFIVQFELEPINAAAPYTAYSAFFFITQRFLARLKIREGK